MKNGKSPNYLLRGLLKNRFFKTCAAHPEIDLVLMDLKMPEMDGYEATRQIKSRKPDLPVLALTAYGLVKDRERAMAAGCDEVVTKPVDKKLLMHSIKKFLGLDV